MEPGLVLVAHRRVRCEGGMQPGRKTLASKPGGDLSERGATRLFGGMAVSDHAMKQNMAWVERPAIFWFFYNANCTPTGGMGMFGIAGRGGGR